MRLGNLRMSCASATRTRYNGTRRPCTAGSLVSVVAVGTATETTTVLRTKLRYRGNDRVVIGRGVLVSRTTIHRDHAGSALCGAFSAHRTELFPFRGCKVAVGVGDVNIINVCACTFIGSAKPATAAPSGATTLFLDSTTTSTAATTVNVGPGCAVIATLPTSSLAVGICVLLLSVLARDVCGHELAGSVEVLLHAVEYGCYDSFNTCVSCIHAAEQGFHPLQFGITCMSVLFKCSELFFELCDILFQRKDLFVFVIKP